MRARSIRRSIARTDPRPPGTTNVLTEVTISLARAANPASISCSTGVPPARASNAATGGRTDQNARRSDVMDTGAAVRSTGANTAACTAARRKQAGHRWMR